MSGAIHQINTGLLTISPTNSSAAVGLHFWFIFYRRHHNKVIRTAKSILSSYYLEQFSSLHNCDPRRWWKHNKPLTGLGKASSNLHAMANSLCGGDLSTLAGKVNSFFESVSRYLGPWTRVWFRLIAQSLCTI